MMAQNSALAAEVVQTAKKLPAVRQEAKRIGLPLTTSDLRRNPPIPPNQNAASLYRQAVARYEQSGGEDMLPKGWTEYLKTTRTEASRRAAQTVRSRFAGLRNLAASAASRPHCDFKRVWEDGPLTPFSEFPVMRLMAQLLAADAVQYMETNNPIGAITSLKAGAVIARHASEDPSLIALLVGIAISTLLDRPFQELLQRFGNRRDVLIASESLHQRLTNVPNLRLALRGEAYMVLPMLEAFRQGDMAMWKELTEAEFPPMNPVARTAFADAMEVRYLEYYIALFRLLGKPGLTQHRLWASMKSHIATHEAKARVARSYTLSTIMTPVSGAAMAKIIQMEAITRVRRAAITALKSRPVNGQFPASLPNLPLDPFTDKPLRYRRVVNGFAVYSLSINETDEGGDSKPIGSGEYRTHPRDVVFRYPTSDG